MNNIRRNRAQVRGEINRVKANITQIKDKNSEIYFTEEDKVILLPRYEKLLKELETELKNMPYENETEVNFYNPLS